MTKEELNKQIEDLKQVLGEPDWDFDRTPLNESAKKIKELRDAFKSQQMKEHWESKKSVKNTLDDVDVKFAKSLPAKPIYIEDHDLKGFTELEVAIIEAWFENRDMNHQQLAKQFGLPRQTITKLFHNPRFSQLKLKYYEYVLPDKTRLALDKLVDAGHEKTVLRMGEHYGILKAEKQEINLTNKPIDDPEVIKLLQELNQINKNIHD